MIKYTLSGFADEISPKLDVQIATLKEIGVNHIEMRSVNEKNIGDFSVFFAKRIKKKLDKNNIKISALGSPIGKIDINGNFEKHFKKFKHIVKLAKIFDTKYIRMFSFYIENEETHDEYYEKVVARLKKLIEYAKEQDVVLLHENEKGIFGDTPERCKKLFDELYCDSFRCTFDPANFVQCGSNTVEAFDLLSNYVEYMHIKDAKLSDGLVVPPGKGDGKIKELMQKLSEKNYSGFISLEPHLMKFAGLEALENGENHSIDTTTALDGVTAFKLAHSALSDILSTVE